MAQGFDRRSFIALGVAGLGVSAVGGCARAHETESPAPTGAAAGPTTLMIIRHAEKPTGSGPRGVTEDGDTDAESLTVRGWTRAGALIELFAAETGDGSRSSRIGLSRPDSVYASDPGRRGSKRPEQTLTPLAEALGIALHTPVAKGEEAELVSILSAAGGTTLVAWEHEAIHAIVSQLGVITPVPPSTWPGDRFDMVWVFTRESARSWSFRQVPQLLMRGDSPEPIGA